MCHGQRHLSLAAREATASAARRNTVGRKECISGYTSQVVLHEGKSGYTPGAKPEAEAVGQAVLLLTPSSLCANLPSYTAQDDTTHSDASHIIQSRNASQMRL